MSDPFDPGWAAPLMDDPGEFDISEVTDLLATIVNPHDRDTVAPQEFLIPPVESPYTARLDGLRVTRLRGVGPQRRPFTTLEKLTYGLKCALRIEFATIPLYLTALWSIIDQAHPVAKSVRAVAHEEMLHLALICNLLSALGERPVLTGKAVPQFPRRLPGGVHPELKLELQGYGPRALKTFMEIERPDTPTAIIGEPTEIFFQEDKTIGAFYIKLIAAFKKAFAEEDLKLDPKWQIAGPFAWLVMTNPEAVNNALTLIMVQGEGARDGVPYSRDPRYLSHYYRFKSLAMLTELVWDKDKRVLRKGDPIQPPAVFTLAPAPPKGYGLAAPREVRKTSEKFEETYSDMLRLLEASWNKAGDDTFVEALEKMFDLGALAQTLMHIGTPDGRGHCPTFRYRHKKSAGLKGIP